LIKTILIVLISSVCVAQFGLSEKQAKEALAYDSCLCRGGHCWNEKQMHKAEIDRGWHCQAAREADRLYQAGKLKSCDKYWLDQYVKGKTSCNQQGFISGTLQGVDCFSTTMDGLPTCCNTECPEKVKGEK